MVIYFEYFEEVPHDTGASRVASEGGAHGVQLVGNVGCLVTPPKSDKTLAGVCSVCVKLFFLWVLLLSCGLAMSQGEWVPPGTYAQPFVSRISTPSAAPESILPPFLSLDSPSLTVGATNAGAGNVAGAGR